MSESKNYPCVKADKVLLRNAQYNDLPISLAYAKVPAANTPTWTALTANTAAYTFAVNDYADISPSEMLHGWKEGTPFELHLHWCTNGVDLTDRYVRWQIFFALGDDDGVLSAEQNAEVETTIPASTTDNTMVYSSFGYHAAVGYTIGTIGTLRLKRIAAVGGLAPAADPYGLMVGVHYEVDTLGSDSLGTK